MWVIYWSGLARELQSCGTTISWTRRAVGWENWMSTVYTGGVTYWKEKNGSRITGSQHLTKMEHISLAHGSIFINLRLSMSSLGLNEVFNYEKKTQLGISLSTGLRGCVHIGSQFYLMFLSYLYLFKKIPFYENLTLTIITYSWSKAIWSHETYLLKIPLPTGFYF